MSCVRPRLLRANAGPTVPEGLGSVTRRWTNKVAIKPSLLKPRRNNNAVRQD